MKTNLKNILGLAALGVTLLATTVPTWAGFVDTPEVYIGINGNGVPYARGSMVGARYSADSLQFIGCKIVIASGSPPHPDIECYASNSADERFFCRSFNPNHIQAVQAMTDSSYIYVEEARDKGGCGAVSITDSSGLLE